MSAFAAPSGLRPAQAFRLSVPGQRRDSTTSGSPTGRSGGSSAAPSAAVGDSGSSGPENPARRRRSSRQQLPEEVAAAVTSALLPRVEALGQPAAPPLDPTALAQAVAARLAPELRQHPLAVASAITEVLIPRLRDALCAAAFVAPPACKAVLLEEGEREGAGTEEPRASLAVPRPAAPKAVSFQGAEAPAGGLRSPRGGEAVAEDPRDAVLSQERLPSKQPKEERLASKHRKVALHSSERVLRRAFVVNFRRLMDLQKRLAVIHELIKSTAIAALTLVKAGNPWQLIYSVFFVAILLTLYGFHFGHYDNLDISDYRHLAELLEDDHCEWGGRQVANPNRFLKALTLSKPGRRRRAIYAIAFFSVLCLLMWLLLFGQWCFGLELFARHMHLLDPEFYATLLLVGTVMLVFHVIFEHVYWRETQCVMPPCEDGQPWDPRRHGVPRRYRLFGLPSMWFTSPEAHDALRLWIAHAQTLPPERRCPKISPEEMAIFALDPDGCSHLRNALLHAKLYGAHEQAFLALDEDQQRASRLLEPREEPEELGMNLVFYDNQSREYSLPDEDYHQGQVHLLRRGGSMGTYILPGQRGTWSFDKRRGACLQDSV